MVKVNVLADALKTLVNAEKQSKKQVMLRPASKIVIKFLRVMQKHGNFFIIFPLLILIQRDSYFITAALSYKKLS